MSPGGSQIGGISKETERKYLILASTLLLLALIGACAYIIGGLINGPDHSSASPTATPLPPPLVNIQAIKAQAKLSTVEYSTLTEIYSETAPAGWLDEFLGNKEQLLMLVYGQVNAGFDLDKLEEGDLWTDGQRVRLVLPAPEIVNSSIDFERTHTVYYDNSLILDDTNPNLQGEALKQAKQAIEEAALQEGVLEQANAYGQLYYENFLYALGFTDVEVVVDAQIFKE